MSTPQAELMTTEQLLAMPNDGVERWLIRGELRENVESDATRRNHGHSRVSAKICQRLQNWVDQQPEPHGEVLVGEAGVRIRREPDTTVGIDVTYISPETADANPDEERIVEGVPVLVAEVLSPSDKHEDISDKVESYLEAGVNVVWVVDPAFRTITVYSPNTEPRLFNVTQTIDAEPYLPGFCLPVREIFSR